MSLFFSLGTKRSLFFALCKLNLTKSAQRYNKNFTYASVRVFFFAKVTILSLDFRRIGHFAGCKRVSVSLWVILQAGRDTPLKSSSFGIA